LPARHEQAFGNRGSAARVAVRQSDVEARSVRKAGHCHVEPKPATLPPSPARSRSTMPARPKSCAERPRVRSGGSLCSTCWARFWGCCGSAPPSTRSCGSTEVGRQLPRRRGRLLPRRRQPRLVAGDRRRRRVEYGEAGSPTVAGGIAVGNTPRW